MTLASYRHCTGYLCFLLKNWLHSFACVCLVLQHLTHLAPTSQLSLPPPPPSLPAPPVSVPFASWIHPAAGARFPWPPHSRERTSTLQSLQVMEIERGMPTKSVFSITTPVHTCRQEATAHHGQYGMCTFDHTEGDVFSRDRSHDMLTGVSQSYMQCCPATTPCIQVHICRLRVLILFTFRFCCLLFSSTTGQFPSLKLKKDMTLGSSSTVILKEPFYLPVKLGVD